MKHAFLCLLAACSPAVRLPSSMQALPVAVIAWPSPIRPTCDLAELPQQPPMPGHEAATDANALERYYVNSRDVAAMTEWSFAVKKWADQITRCLGKMSDPSK